jgi:hypothetical protein
MGVSGQSHAPSALYPGERAPGTRWMEASLTSELVWAQRLEEKSCVFSGDRNPVIQSVVRHYTD